MNSSLCSSTKMARIIIALAALVAVASARMGYQLPSGSEFLLRSTLQTTFTCDELPYGYYADMDNDCQLFHVCLPVADDIGAVVETAHFTFVCGNQTVFSQETLTCVHEADAFPCAESRSLYDLANADFGKIPEELN